MSSNSWNQTLVTAQVAGTAVANTTTPTSLLTGTQAKFTIPANYLKIGDILRVKSAGQISTSGTNTTLTFDVRAGASTVLFNGGASANLVISQTNLTWDFEAYLTWRAVGTSGNAIGVGRVLSAAYSATTPIVLIPATAPAVGSNQDTTTSFVLDHFVTWGTATSGNSIQLLSYELALLT